MRLSVTGFTLPWQAVAAHEPGPMYFASVASDFCAFAAEANPAQAAKRTRVNGRMSRAVNCIAAKGEIFRMNALRVLLFYLWKNKESTTAKRDVHKLNAGYERSTLHRCAC